jgi:hypothetical protein
MGWKYVVSRQGEVVAVFTDVFRYTFDVQAHRINFYNPRRELVGTFEGARLGDTVTPLIAGFTAPTIPTN